MATITPQALEAEIRRLAAESPDYVYDEGTEEEDGRTCWYTKRDDDGSLRGSCVFGRALITLGTDPEEMRSHEHHGITEVLADMGIVPDRSTPLARWADFVQDRQDAQHAWGSALSQADEYMAGWGVE